MMHATHGTMNWWAFGPGMVLMVTFWILIVVGLIALIKWLFDQSNSSGKNSPQEILKRRYAKGEIKQEEFEKKKRELEGK